MLKEIMLQSLIGSGLTFAAYLATGALNKDWKFTGQLLLASVLGLTGLSICDPKSLEPVGPEAMLIGGATLFAGIATIVIAIVGCYDKPKAKPLGIKFM
jgi:hypothetical protein